MHSAEDFLDSFHTTTYEGKESANYEYIRKIDQGQYDNFLDDVHGANFTCNRMNDSPFTLSGTKTLEVTAGSVLGLNMYLSIIHPGPMQFHLAEVPSDSSAETFDGKSQSWFKIQSDGDEVTFPEGRMTWPNYEEKNFTVTIPPCIKDGECLLRAEHIALHSAARIDGAQFYIGCVQLKVVGGTGTAEPSQLLAFPGAYDPEDSGLVVTVWYNQPENYTAPGGPVLKC